MLKSKAILLFKFRVRVQVDGNDSDARLSRSLMERKIKPPAKAFLRRLLCLLLIISGADLNLIAAENNTANSGTPILIKGVTGERLQNILLNLNIRNGQVPLSPLGFPRSTEFILRKTAEALRALGFYQPEIEIDPDSEKLALLVKLGDPVVWSNIDIQIEKSDELPGTIKKLLESQPFVKGSTINHGVYRQFKEKLQAELIQYGYFDAKFSQQQLIIDQSNFRADIVWKIAIGRRYQFGEVKTIGSRLSPDFLARYIEMKTGQNYSQEAILDSQQVLNRSGYFNRVNVEPDIDRQTKTVGLLFELADTEQYELKTSLGYGSDSGARVGVVVENKLFNERGHNFAFGVNYDELELGTSFQYKIPLTSREDYWLNRIRYREKDDELANSQIMTYESSWLYKLGTNWSSLWTLSLAKEKVTESDSIENSLNYLVPSVQFNYYSVSDPFSATEGFHWQQDYRFSDKALSDPDIDFFQISQKIKWINQLSTKWRILLRGQVGYTEMTLDSFNRAMPTDYRYAAGGSVSVRGYKYQTLAPVDADNNLLGAKHQLIASIEVDRLVSDDIRWALFYDTGNAFNDWEDMQLKSAIGTGVRWITPIGSIRLDYARGLDDPKAWEAHITIGPDL